MLSGRCRIGAAQPPEPDARYQSMRRPPATVVVPAWNAWDQTQACLESLRPTLGVQDQVIVVDNGSTDATAARLKLFSWAEVVTNETNLGLAEAYNVGAGLAQHDLIVFLHNDTVLTGHWLDNLLAPFERPRRRSGRTPVELLLGTAGCRRGVLPRRRHPRHAPVRPRVGAGPPGRRLDGRAPGLVLSRPCAAPRSTRSWASTRTPLVGGIEEDDLCRRLTAKGWRLRVANGSFVHHAGHRTYVANGVDWFAGAKPTAPASRSAGVRPCPSPSRWSRPA